VRRTFAMVTAAAVLAPATVLATGGPAAAATTTLIITALGRSGAKVITTTSVTNLADGSTYDVTTGTAKKLPKSKYAVIADIWDAKTQTETLGAAIVTVTGKKKVTIDARKGKALTVTLNSGPTAGHEQSLEGRICVAGRYSGSVGAWGRPGAFFVVPNASKDLRLAYMSTWLPNTGPGEAYAVTGVSKGVPTKPGKAFKRSSLGTLNLTARRGTAGSPQTDLAVQPGGDCDGGFYSQLHSGETPFTVKAHVSAGHWLVRASTSADFGFFGSHFNPRKVAAGKTYSQTFFRSAWGPGSNLPYVYAKALTFDTSDMFQEPGFSARGSNTQWEAAVQAVNTLKLGSKVVAKKTTTDYGTDRSEFRHTLKTSGWYTLTVDAKRYHPDLSSYPADMLSSRTSATFRFWANPKVPAVSPVFNTRFLPAGLDLHNRAKPGSITTVDLKQERPSQGPDIKLPTVKVKKVAATASFDGGKTWKVVTVKRSGSVWKALIGNPASGAVSLRATSRTRRATARRSPSSGRTQSASRRPGCPGRGARPGVGRATASSPPGRDAARPAATAARPATPTTGGGT
jgi:hypothetical protein